MKTHALSRETSVSSSRLKIRTRVVFGEGAGLHLVDQGCDVFTSCKWGSRLSLLPRDKEMLRSHRGQAGRRQAVGIYALHFVFMGLSSV